MMISSQVYTDIFIDQWNCIQSFFTTATGLPKLNSFIKTALKQIIRLTHLTN